MWEARAPESGFKTVRHRHGPAARAPTTLGSATAAPRPREPLTRALTRPPAALRLDPRQMEPV